MGVEFVGHVGFEPLSEGFRRPLPRLADAPIEISGFPLEEIDQVILGDEPEATEQGPVAPEADAVPGARLGDILRLGEHRIVCGDATDPALLSRLLDGAPSARLILTDEPYNVAIAGNVTGR